MFKTPILINGYLTSPQERTRAKESVKEWKTCGKGGIGRREKLSMSSGVNMEFQVRMLRRSLRDLEDIYKEIHASDSEAAFRWFKGLNGAILSLEANPARGAITAESKHYRQLLYGRKPNIYRIIYNIEIDNRIVNVIHLRHGARREFTSADLQ